MIISLIVAMDAKGGIGRQNRLPWHLPDDLKRFKQLTMGHHLIMGRKTYESIGRPLKGRKMIVLSRRHQPNAGEIIFVPDMNAAIEICRKAGETEVFVVGGAEVFREALPFAQRIYLTKIMAEVEADTFFPKWDESEWEIISQTEHPADDRHAFSFRFVDYVKRSTQIREVG